MSAQSPAVLIGTELPETVYGLARATMLVPLCCHWLIPAYNRYSLPSTCSTVGSIEYESWFGGTSFALKWYVPAGLSVSDSST